MNLFPKNRRGRVCLFVLACAGVWFLQDLFVSVPLKISQETTSLTQPLTKDGTFVNYFAYVQSLAPKDSASDKNLIRRIVRILGPAELPTPELETLFLEALDLESVKPALTFESAEDAFVKYWTGTHADSDAAKSEPDEWGITPLAQEALDEFAKIGENDFSSPVFEDAFAVEWLKANSPALDALRDAVQECAHCFVPLVSASEIPKLVTALSQESMRLVGMAEGLAFRARYRLLHGNFDGAMEDKLTCLRLGRMLQKDSMLIIDLIHGYRIEGIGNALPLSASLETPVPQEVLLRLRELPECPDRMEQFKRIFETSELWTQLDLIQTLSHADPEVMELLIEDERLLSAVKYLGIDWNRAAVRVQQLYREYAENSTDREQLLKTSEGLENAPQSTHSLLSCLTRRGRSEELANVLTHFFPSGIHAGRLVFREEMSESLTRIGCAFLLYRLEHDGQFPPAFTRNAEGTALHSWRVLILPYLGEAEKMLYEKIRLDEPWDSPWNRQFYAQMPEVYRTPNRKEVLSSEFPEEAQTRFSVILGENGLFNDPGIGADREKRNAVRAALVTERETAGCWMDPNGELRAEEILKEFPYLPEESSEEMEEARETASPQRVTLFPLGSVSTVLLESKKELRLWAVGEESLEMEESDE